MTDTEIAKGSPATAAPTAPPSREAIGLGESRWIDGQGHTLVEAPNTPQARIRPRNRTQVDGMYRRMFDAPPEEFYAPYPAKATERNVPVSDQGLLARYRGAMTQGLYMLDDWPSARVVRQLPDAISGGGIDWAVVERLGASGPPPQRTTARKALAGKRSLDLYTHRIRTAPDPDLEVRKLVTQYHLDQVSGRFEGPQHTKTTYWRDRADAIADAINESGYRPTPEGLAALRALNLADEARAAFPDIIPEMLRRLDEPSPLLSFVTGGLPAPVRLAEDVVEDAPPPPTQAAPEVTPAPKPISTPEQAAARQKAHATAQAALGAASEPLRRAAAAIEDPALTRYGIVTDEVSAKALAQDAEGRFAFADGYRPKGGTAEDVINGLMIDAEMWADPARMGNWPDVESARLSREWKALDKRFNPEGDLDPADFKGAGKQEMRDALTLRIFDEAQTRALPPGKKKGKLSTINQQYLGAIRQNMLFNYLRVPSYILQNQIGNSINLGAKVGGRAVIDYWTKPATMRAIFRNQKSGYVTQWGAREKAMGLGHLPNVPMSHKAYIDKSMGKLPKGLDVLSRVFAPETLRFIGNIPDQGAREAAASVLVDRGYRRLNQELPGMVMEELRKRKLAVPDAKVRQVTRDFLDSKRTLIDPNTNKPYTTLLGRPAKFEPIWEGHELRDYLRKHLAEDMVRKPPPDLLGNAVDRVFRTTQTMRREILDSAGKGVDDALFSWRNTNADQLASRVFLFHYWQSRQGGLYVSEALKRPGLLSAYGRMMEEMEQQAAELDQPNWLRGFFQMQNSVAGFTMWYAPVDMLQSLLTFADWQYGEDAADAVYKDMTTLGKGASASPFLVHPLLQYGAYAAGLLGPDYYTPSLTGLETFGARAIDLLNLANANDKLPGWVNDAGIGVDPDGNKVPLPVRPLNELYARLGNAISTALEPITGLSPVEVASVVGSQERNIASIGEQETRLAHPEWDQMQVNRFVTDALADPGTDEYQDWFRKAAGMPFMGMENLPGPVQGLSRLVSPFRVYTWPEQVKLDSWEGLAPSGNIPPRNLPEDPDAAERILNEARFGASTTVEGRQLVEANNEYKQLLPPSLAEARTHASKSYLLGVTEPIEAGGVLYAPTDLAAMSSGDLYDLGTQILADAGYTREDVDASYDTQARFLADNPDLAQYRAYTKTVGDYPTGVEGFVTDTAAMNPGFAQFVRSSMMNHQDGTIDYDRAFNPDAYLAAQGVRPSVYSPVVGNEPTLTPGGAPALADVPSGQPLLPEVSGSAPVTVYADPNDAKGGYYAKPPIATLDPGVPMQVIDMRDGYDDGLAQVALPTAPGSPPIVGLVAKSLLQGLADGSAAAAPVAPNPVQPAGGLAGMAGGIVNQLGAVKDALGNAVTSLVGHNSGTPVKPAATTSAPGAFAVEPAPDGMGVKSTLDSDRTWMELMVGTNNATVTTDYKGPTPAGVSYEYQNGHGADGSTHAAYDISCDTGYRADGTSTCPGTPIKAPIAGTVVCSGYGQGTGASLAGCTYSQGTTHATNEKGEPSAHTVVLDVGTDAQGNALQLSFNHMGSSVLQPGQTVNPGDLLGGMGDTDGGPHIHLEGWAACNGTYTIVDPSLIVGGYFQSTPAC